MSDKAKMPAVISAKSKDPAVQKFYDAVKEHIEVRDGQRGDINEAYVRVGDLVDGGIVKKIYGRNPDGSVVIEPVDPLINTTRPPAPTGFAITTAFSHVMMEWDSWTYSNHSHTEIWRSDTNSLGDATKIGTSDGVLYADSVDPGSTHYYWIRFISDANVIGPYNATEGTEGTTAQSVTELMDAIGDEIASSDLSAALTSNINTTFHQATAPESKPDGSSLVAGDIWLDSDDDNKMYMYDGTTPYNATGWFNVQDGGIATAISEASGAQGTADGKVTTYYQDDAPTTGLSDGDLWIDTNDGNKLYRYAIASTTWVDIQDDGIGTAISDASTAQATADGKVQTFYQDAAPTTGLGIGDLWIDTNDENELYRYQDNGAGTNIWVSVQDGGIGTAIANASTAQTTADGKITTFFQDAAPTTGMAEGDIWIDTNDGNNQYLWDANASPAAWVDIQDTAITTAQGTADGKIESYFQNDAPTGLGSIDNGDLWFDTDDGNKMYRWQSVSGTYQWVAIPDEAIQTALDDASTAQATADGKITTFFQDAAPTAEGEGDIWFDTDDGNKMYRWQDNGAGTNAWIDIPDEGIATAIADAATAQNTADGKIQTFYQDAAPTVGLGVGDFWVDTNDNDKLYTWNGTDWVEIKLATQAYVGTQIVEQVGYCQLTDSSGNVSVATAYATKTECEAATPPTGSSYVWQNDQSIASEIHTVSSSVDGNSTTIQQNATAIDGLEGQWVVKIDNNGAVSGFGLASGNYVCIKDDLILASKTDSAACTTAGGAWTAYSEFYINADRFAIIHPTNNGLVSPFIVDGEDTYIANAMIKDASIESAKIASLAADKVDAATLSAITANIGTATAGLLEGPDNRFKIDLNNGYLTVYDASGNLRVRLGKLS